MPQLCSVLSTSNVVPTTIHKFANDVMVNPLGPIAPKVALLTSYGFVASLFQTKFAHDLVFLLVVC